VMGIPDNRHQNLCHVCNVTGLLMVLQGIFCVCWLDLKGVYCLSFCPEIVLYL